jgi:hypothetical protein
MIDISGSKRDSLHTRYKVFFSLLIAQYVLGGVPEMAGASSYG